MFEHLIDPTYTPLSDAEVGSLISAQAATLDFLDDDTIVEATPGEKSLARQAFTSALGNEPEQIKIDHALKLKTPAAVQHLVGMLSAYDWDFVEQAKQIRGYVVAQLLEETKHPDARIRMRALELTGKLTEVGSFTERIEVKKVDATADELQERLRAKLSALLPKTVEVQDANPKESK